MIETLNALIQIGLFCALMALIYAIVQVAEVIREEKDRLMWLRRGRMPVPVKTEEAKNPPSLQ